MHPLSLVLIPALALGAAHASANPFANCKEKLLVENCWIKPCTQTLDFDGNGKADIAYLVSKGATGEKGIAVILSDQSCRVIAADQNDIGSGGTDYQWMTKWEVRKKYRKKSDALKVTKEEIGGVVYFDGTALVWDQEGD